MLAKHTPSRYAALFVLACLGLTLTFTRTASAQLSNMDMTTLIEGLRAEGMNDLLLHLAKTGNIQDPIVRQQIVINQHLLAQDHFNDLADKATPQEALKLRQQAADEFEKALTARRELIKKYNDDDQRPIWQTQLAMQLLGEYLEGMNHNAAQFYEFGVPTVKQKKAYESAVVEALTQLEEADVRFFILQTRLAQEPDHMVKRVNTGLWDRMMEQFYHLRTQYALAQARYAVWLLPDDSEYFTHLGGLFPRQKKTLSDERNRLLGETKEVLDKLIATRAEAHGILAGTQVLLGRVLIAQGQIDPGIALLDKVIQAGQPSLVDLEARLGKAVALEKKNQPSQAMTILDQLSSHSLVNSNLLIRLLVVDAHHKLLMRLAAKAPTADRVKDVAAAYEPYTKLLQNPVLGSSATALRNYIEQRWASSISPSTNLSQVPALVAASMARMLRGEGQNLANQALRAAQANDEAKAKSLQAQAAPKLKRALDIAENLLSRSDITPAARASAMYEKALAIYFTDRQDVANLVKAATILTDLAEQLPDQPQAADALASAMGGILHPLFSQHIGQAEQPYIRAMKIMLEKFPNLPVTNNERYYYAMNVLIPHDENQQAIDVLKVVPNSHPDFYLAQQQIIRSDIVLIKKATADKRVTMVSGVLEKVEQLQNELASARGAAASDPSQAQMIHAVSGAVRIMHADLLALADRVPEAVEVLQNFEQDYTSNQDLVREALGKRIFLEAAAGKLATVRKEASQMMASFPDDAASVIDQVLTGLNTQVDTLRAQRIKELVPDKQKVIDKQIAGISDTAEQLARMLVDWAGTQKFTDDQMLPFEMVLAKSMRLANHADDAVKYMLPLYKKYPNDLDVLSETGEALYASGKKDNLMTASGIFDTIIAGVPPENNKYPAVWWNAWMRRMQVMEKLDLSTKDIPLRVRQLKMTDPQLGGEPYKSELNRLSLKYGG